MIDINKLQAGKIAERLRRTAEKHFGSYPFIPDKTNLTISIGVADFPHDEIDKTELIRKADSALYHAKRTGKNKVCKYSPGMK